MKKVMPLVIGFLLILIMIIPGCLQGCGQGCSMAGAGLGAVQIGRDLMSIDCSAEGLNEISTPELFDLFNDLEQQMITLLGEQYIADQIRSYEDVCGMAQGFTDDGRVVMCSRNLEDYITIGEDAIADAFNSILETMDRSQLNLARLALAPGLSMEEFKEELGSKLDCITNLKERFKNEGYIFEIHCSETGVPYVNILENCSAIPNGFCYQEEPYTNAVCKEDKCGNGVFDDDGRELCDGSDLNDKECTSFGYNGGTLSCNSECYFDFSNCETPEPFIQLAQEPNIEPTICISEDGKIGVTGNKAPKITYGNHWFESYCYPNENTGGSTYCDSTHFMMVLLNRISNIESAETTVSEDAEVHKFEIALMADGLSEDFRKDFDYYYYSNLDFFDSPSFYLDESLNELVLDSSKLVFAQEQIAEPGIYNVELTKNADGSWIVNREKIADPARPSLLYYLPLNGEVGLNKRPDEEMAAREDYGSSFTAQYYYFPDSDSESSEEYGISAQTNFSIVPGNRVPLTKVENKDSLIEIDFKNNEIVLTPSWANVIVARSKKSENNDLPVFFVETDEWWYENEILETPKYFNWHFLGSNKTCNALEINSETQIADYPIETLENQCSDETAISQYQHALGYSPEKEEETIFAAVVYAGKSILVHGLCGTEFIDYYETLDKDENWIWNMVEEPNKWFGGSRGFRLNDIKWRIQDEKVCIREDTENQKLIFFWNPENILLDKIVQLEMLTEMECNNPKFFTEIVDAKSSFDKYRQQESITIWAEIREITEFSNSNIQLYITRPDGTETRQEVVFYDDGQHNDFGYRDNIFAATIPEGFEDQGTYHFRVELIDNQEHMSEYSGIFEVEEYMTCEIVQYSGDVTDKINMVFVGDKINEGENMALFVKFMQDGIQKYFETDPIANFRDKYNVFATYENADLGCSTHEMTTHVGSMLTCNTEEAKRMANACVTFNRETRSALDNVVVIASSEYGRANWSRSSTRIPYIEDPLVLVHELGHQLEIRDYYTGIVGESLGIGTNEITIGDATETNTNCEELETLHCNMCSQFTWPHFTDCGLTYRFNCNMSIENATGFGECPEEEKDLNDYEFVSWVLNQVG